MKVISVNGNKRYYNSFLCPHRIGMPAIECYGINDSWKFNGFPHRLNGRSSRLLGHNFYDLYDKRININVGRLII